MRSLIITIKKHLFDYAVEDEITHNTVYVTLSTVIATEESIYSDIEG